MKKLQLFTGGHPNSLDDYEHIQEGHIESLNAVLAGLIFPNVACILTGCVYDGNNLTAGTFSSGVLSAVAAKQASGIC